MSRRILALGLTVAAFSSALAVPGVAPAAQSGVTGDPWIDQYIEQVPTASGGKPSNPSGSGHHSGLTRAQVQELANAGGDRFAASAAMAVAPVQRGEGSATGTGKGTGRSGRAKTSRIHAPASTSAIIDAIKGTDGGLGPVLPAVLIASLVGAIAFAALRSRRQS
jgi:hypothetical protein